VTARAHQRAKSHPSDYDDVDRKHVLLAHAHASSRQFRGAGAQDEGWLDLDLVIAAEVTPGKRISGQVAMESSEGD
jgi:hypothetical protein